MKRPVDWELRADREIQKSYGDLLALFPHHPIERVKGIVRWQVNPLMRWISERIDLNEMCVAAQRNQFSADDYMKFYRDMGYSLCGFLEVFGERLGLYQDDEDN